MSAADPVCVPAQGITVGFAAHHTEPDQIELHLIMELPPPIGRLHVVLEPDQIATVHDTLHRAMTMTDEEVRDFVAHIHAETEKEKDK